MTRASARSETADYHPGSSAPIAPKGKGAALKCGQDVAGQLGDIKDADREHFIAFYLDARHRVIERYTVAIGSLTGVDVHPREVFKRAILCSSAAVIFAHNHPSGDPTPSAQDVELTRRLRECGELLGIKVLDHVVVGAEGHVSMADRGWC